MKINKNWKIYCAMSSKSGAKQSNRTNVLFEVLSAMGCIFKKFVILRITLKIKGTYNIKAIPFGFWVPKAKRL